MSELNLQSRLNEVMDELSDARSMLELTKERLNDQKWLPPDRLVVCLKVTHLFVKVPRPGDSERTFAVF